MFIIVKVKLEQKFKTTILFRKQQIHISLRKFSNYTSVKIISSL